MTTPETETPKMSTISSFDFGKHFIYIGAHIDGVPEGNGLLVHKNTVDSLYDGKWSNGKFHGKGTSYYFKSGNIKKEGIWNKGNFESGKVYKETGKIHYTV